ncbi:MAG: hypothetical protein GTO29_08740 [Candidatus Latescibacteria bacterium]|nr:hypothetical protein [Candidatus Latescibacterota bacterium]NIO56249.1 hypothetical protein [Candidatus Latescibacterota bacterium]
MEKFDSQREALFRADYAVTSLTNVRFGLILGAVLYALFGPLDLWMLPESWRQVHIIRFAVVVPTCLGVLALTFNGRAKQRLQELAVVFVLFAGLGIVCMILVAQEHEPGFRYYYAGLMLVLTYSFTVVRLRFRSTAVCCIVIIIAYEFVAVFDQRLLSEGLLQGRGPIFINNNFFLISAGIITLFGAYALEDYSRKDFRQRSELAIALEELRVTQAQLVQAERTSATANVVAGLLHELNNPVGAIVGAADVVHRGAQQLELTDRSNTSKTDEEQSQMRSRIISAIQKGATALEDATERVKQTLEVLKRFTRLDHAQTADYNLNQALADCLTLLARETGDRITVKRDFGELPSIRCHAREINQLLMSVLKNAVEAISNTGVIEIRTSAREGSVLIDIVDTGVGIPQERMKNLFAPSFTRETGRVKLGLGLMTSQSIVQRHGGEIVVESTEGKGTRVHIRLPETVVTEPR